MAVIIRPVNVADITDALVEWLRAWPALVDMGAAIDDSEPPNENPERCPCVGVYRSRASFVPRTVGMGAGYRTQKITIMLQMTAASTGAGAASGSGADCKRRLEDLIQAVSGALCSNESLSGTVDTLEDINIVYSNYAQVGAAYFQEAVATVVASTRVAATIT